MPFKDPEQRKANDRLRKREARARTRAEKEARERAAVRGLPSPEVLSQTRTRTITDEDDPHLALIQEQIDLLRAQRPETPKELNERAKTLAELATKADRIASGKRIERRLDEDREEREAPPEDPIRAQIQSLSPEELRRHMHEARVRNAVCPIAFRTTLEDLLSQVQNFLADAYTHHVWAETDPLANSEWEELIEWVRERAGFVRTRPPGTRERGSTEPKRAPTQRP
jgi:hypothetical protein